MEPIIINKLDTITMINFIMSKQILTLFDTICLNFSKKGII